MGLLSSWGFGVVPFPRLFSPSQVEALVMTLKHNRDELERDTAASGARLGRSNVMTGFDVIDFNICSYILASASTMLTTCLTPLLLCFLAS